MQQGVFPILLFRILWTRKPFSTPPRSSDTSPPPKKKLDFFFNDNSKLRNKRRRTRCSTLKIKIKIREGKKKTKKNEARESAKAFEQQQHKRRLGLCRRRPRQPTTPSSGSARTKQGKGGVCMGTRKCSPGNNCSMRKFPTNWTRTSKIPNFT